MTKKVLIALAVMAICANSSYAVESSGKMGIVSAPFFKDAITGLEMVFVRGGCYQMGAVDDDAEAYSEEYPRHDVCVGDFFIGKYEVTQGQWKAIMGGNLTASSSCAESGCPVDSVSWNDVQLFMRKLNRESGDGKFRLPTEAEWEYAARSGGKRETFSGGNDLNRVAWYAENSGRINHRVGTKAPNGLGIYDMTGNVWEWTSDWYGSEFYQSGPRNNPTGPDSGDDHVVRGGCVTGEAANQRVTRRTAYAPDFRKPALGFRLLRIP